LEEGCAIMMDSASYHSVTINKVSNSSNRKQDISEWLQQGGVHICPTETKSQPSRKMRDNTKGTNWPMKGGIK
jgi:hypothetical protein